MTEPRAKRKGWVKSYTSKMHEDVKAGRFVRRSLLPRTPIPSVLRLARVRHVIHACFTETASKVGLAISIIINAATITSIVAFSIASLPEYRIRRIRGEYGIEEQCFAAIEVVCVAVFAVDYLVRFLTYSAVPTEEELQSFLAYNSAKKAAADGTAQTQTAGAGAGSPVAASPSAHSHSQSDSPSSTSDDSDGRSALPSLPPTYTGAAPLAQRVKRWLRRQAVFMAAPLNIIDLAAIAPFFVPVDTSSAETNSTTLLRVLRLARVLRLFRLSEHSVALPLLMRTMKRSVDALVILFFIVALGVILFGSIIFYAEGGEYDPETGYFMRSNLLDTDVEISPFQSIPHSFWWSMVTMTTVGYGDFYPTSKWGRAIGAAAMMSGVLVIALPVTVIGSNFSEEYAAAKEAEAKRRAEVAKLAAEKKSAAAKRLQATAGGVLARLHGGHGQRHFRLRTVLSGVKGDAANGGAGGGVPASPSSASASASSFAAPPTGVQLNPLLQAQVHTGDSSRAHAGAGAAAAVGRGPAMSMVAMAALKAAHQNPHPHANPLANLHAQQRHHWQSQEPSARPPPAAGESMRTLTTAVQALSAEVAAMRQQQAVMTALLEKLASGR